MELSFDHRFVFIHVPKTGGESVAEALRPFSAVPPVPPGGRTPVIRKLYANALYQLRERRYGHITAKELRAALPGDFFETAFKFAFVRNPWDWHVSIYHYVVQHPEHDDHARYVELGSFDAYLEQRAAEGAELQSDYVLGDDGELLVDFVGRQEALAEHFALACERIGIRASLPHVNRSSHRDFRSYYSPRTRELVARFCRRDVEAFGYAFEPQPVLAPIERIAA